MFKCDLDRLHREEQVKDYLRESAWLQVASSPPRRPLVIYSCLVLLAVAVVLAAGVLLVVSNA